MWQRRALTAPRPLSDARAPKRQSANAESGGHSIKPDLAAYASAKGSAKEGSETRPEGCRARLVSHRRADPGALPVR
jgi:hypothetical protein